MTPLRVEALLDGPLVSSSVWGLHLDGLLAAAVAKRDQVPAAFTREELLLIEVPVAREPGGRFHLASASLGRLEVIETKWCQRRFPLAEAMVFGDIGHKINLSAGAQKNFRYPMEIGYLEEDRLRWYCVGDAGEVRGLLRYVHHLGKKRNVGLGRVRTWRVEECEAWDGFPVLGPGGEALRHLPPDWPSLKVHVLRYGTLTYPYWAKWAEELVAAPMPVC